MQKENVRINGYRGKWHSIDCKVYGSHTLFLMEHDFYGDETESLIINTDNQLVLDDVWNGWEDFEYFLADYTNDYNSYMNINEAIEFLMNQHKTED